MRIDIVYCLFLLRITSQFDVGGSVESLSLLDIREDGSQFEWISVVLEAFGAFQVEPQYLIYFGGTYSTLHFISGTWSLTDFSLRQVMKLSSRKLHSALGNGKGTLRGSGERIVGPFAIIL